jgi:hypothetical protein
MLDKLRAVEERYEELTRLMADPEVAQDYERVAEYAIASTNLPPRSSKGPGPCWPRTSIPNCVKWPKERSPA